MTRIRRWGSVVLGTEALGHALTAEFGADVEVSITSDTADVFEVCVAASVAPESLDS